MASPPLAVTIGEPAGVGPDITLTAWFDRQRHAVPNFYCYGDVDLLRGRAAQIGLDCPIVESSPELAGDHFANALPVIPLEAPIKARSGHPDPANAAAVIEAIARAVGDIRSGRAAAVVTNPISKQILYDAGFNHPGHTEFLGTLSAAWTGVRTRPVMMLAGPELRAVPVTIHIPLRDVAPALTTSLIAETGRTVAFDLKRRFGVPKPRLAVAGLNPHAGEGGALGGEDAEVIRPAIEQLRADGIAATGPHSADILFHAGARGGYDAVLCMYHDQALIPAKTLSFSETVNVTLGLAFVRTSPDHGTAFDIAGSGQADPSSFRAALRMAAALRRNEEKALAAVDG